MNRGGARTPYDQYANRVETTSSDTYGYRDEMAARSDLYRNRSRSRTPIDPFGNGRADPRESNSKDNRRRGGNLTPEGVPRAVPLGHKAQESMQTDLHNVIQRPTGYPADEK